MVLHRSSSRVKFAGRTKYGAAGKKTKYETIDENPAGADEPGTSTARRKAKEPSRQLKSKHQNAFGRRKSNHPKQKESKTEVTDWDGEFSKKQTPTVGDLASRGRLTSELRFTSTRVVNIVRDVGRAAGNDCAVWEDSCAIVSDDEYEDVEDNDEHRTVVDEDDCAIVSDDDYDGSPPASLLIETSPFKPSDDSFRVAQKSQSHSPSSPSTTSTIKPLLQTVIQFIVGKKRTNSPSAPVEVSDPPNPFAIPIVPRRRDFPHQPLRKITVAQCIAPAIRPGFKFLPPLPPPPETSGYEKPKTPKGPHPTIGFARVEPETFVAETVQRGFENKSGYQQPKRVNCSDASIFDGENEKWKIWGAKFSTLEDLRAQRNCEVAGDYWLRLGEQGYQIDW